MKEVRGCSKNVSNHLVAMSFVGEGEDYKPPEVVTSRGAARPLLMMAYKGKGKGKKKHAQISLQAWV